LRIEDIKSHYREREEEIENRMKDFENLRSSSKERYFLELAFVILSSQTKAKEAWKASQKLSELDLLMEGDEDDILEILEKYSISYEKSKAEYIVKARENLSQPTLADTSGKLKLKSSMPEDPEKAREWLVEKVPGISWKGASHFLRNIGYSFDFGIASTHTLSVLSEMGKTESAKPPNSKKEYLEFEKKIREIAEKIETSPGTLDLVLWSKKTEEVFK